ncbi:VIT family-domain-containing protein [Xylariaceae sp. FL0804]|nr:VIT family-domain-containing protein [Xylariaceae sp. FL0804]
MGLGGYLGARSEEDSHAQTLRETRAALAFASTPPSPSPCAPASPASCASSTTTNPAAEAAVLRVFAPYDLPPPLAGDLARHLARAPTDDVVDFLMRFEHGVPGGGSGSSSSSSSRPLTCALTIAGAYFLGGFVPLVPYFLVGPGDGGDGGDAVLRALWWSLGVMAASLFAFGYAKTCFVTGEWRGRAALGAGLAGAAQMVVVGGIAAGCAMGLVRLFNSFAG